MLEKETNRLRINRLRVVNKFEADYNLVLAHFQPHVATHYTGKQKNCLRISKVLNIFVVPIVQ